MKIILVLVMSLYIAEISGNPKLLFANRKDIRVISFTEGKLSKSILVKDVNDAASVDYYFKKQEVCWTDIGNEFIKCVSLNGTDEKSNLQEIKLISRGITSPDGMAIDWLTEKIYWADSETDKIEVAELYGPNRKVLYWRELDQPRAIALVPSEGIMFWSDWGESPKLEKGGMNGDLSSRKIIVNNDIIWPNGLTVDFESRRLFWADGKHYSISSVNFDGMNRVKVIDQLQHPFALTYFEHTLYWTDWRTEAIHYCSLNSQNKCEREKQLSLKLSPMYIHVYDELRQSNSNTVCQTLNGGCSHLCLLAPYPENYTCACPTGVNLINKFTCDKGPKEMLLLARRSDLRRISLDTSDRTPVVLPVTNVHHAIAIDYDPIEGFFYWTDDEAFLIQRAKLNGSDQQVLIYSDGLDSDGIAIEWLARNLYWSDAKNKRIEVAKLDGTSRKILLRGGLDEPRAIALYPEGGLMFWTDWGNKSKIERSFLDGSNRSTIVDTRLGWPNGVAVDRFEFKIYWVDARTQVIEVAELDGSSRRILLSKNLPHVFGFSLLGDFLYWTDWQKRSIERVHKHNESFREILVDQLPDVMGLKALSVNQKMGSSPCMLRNGNCSHLCFNRPRGAYICDCPLGYELASDGRTCIIPKAFILYSRREFMNRISLKTFTTSVLPMPYLQKPTSIDSDEEGKLYWCDLSSNAILRSYMNGSLPEVVIQFGSAHSESLAVDWMGKNLYWSDMNNNRVEVSKLDGSWGKVILWNISSPSSVAVDSIHQVLYWSEWEDEGGKIMKSFLDGSMPSVVVEDVGRIKEINIDSNENYIYWLDIDKKQIKKAELNGHNKTIIVDNIENANSFALGENYVFWFDATSNTIERALKSSGLERDVIKSDAEGILDIYMFWNKRSTFEENPCLIANGNCSHLCIRLPRAESLYTCACPTHFILSDDAKTCLPPCSFLMFSQKSSVTRLSVDPFQYPTAVLPIQNIKNVHSIGFDPISDSLFWIDSRSQVIRKSSQMGKNSKILIKGKNLKPFDLVVDSNSELVFWSCASNNIINITKFDGTEVGTVLGHNSITKPRSLGFHNTKSILFYTNMIKSPTIEKISLNGLRRRIVINENLATPLALAVDSEDGMLFWVDYTPMSIHASDLNGQNRRILSDSGFVSPLSLTVHESHLYWIDSGAKTVERINKFTGQERESVVTKTSQLTDIISVSRHFLEETKKHPCLQEGKRCSHICLSSESSEDVQEYSFLMPLDSLISYKNDAMTEKNPRFSPRFHCECPLGMVLSQNELTCVPKPVCPPKQFSCLSGQNCVPLQWRCDGIKECSDGSDELNCSPPIICDSSTMFRCFSGECIENILVCDQTPHCSDGSDEIECCPSGEAVCESNGRCIPCSSPERCPEKLGQCPFPITHLPSGGVNVEESNARSGSRAPYVVGVFASAVVLLCVMAIAYYYRRRPTLLDEGETEVQVLKETRSRQQHYRVLMSGGKVYTGIRGEMGPLHGRGLVVGADASCPNVVMNVGDRGATQQVTGASSSSSSLTTHYPRETINPPPTPVANSRILCHDTHCCYPSHAVGAPISLNSYRHYKSHNRPPPPTPCSTDVCGDDSDFLTASHRFSPPSTCFSSSPPPTTTDCDDSEDPCPPPPTPVASSCPPSPSTDRSYFIRAPCPSPLSNSPSE